jgi:hypothetical protein
LHQTLGETININRYEEPVWVIWVRWLARVTSLVSAGLLLLFIIGEGGSGPNPITAREWIGLLFFPFGVVVGMLIAWRREVLGSLVSIGSLACFYIVYGLVLAHRLQLGSAFALFTAPAFLFLLSGLVSRNDTAKSSV